MSVTCKGALPPSFHSKKRARFQNDQNMDNSLLGQFVLVVVLLTDSLIVLKPRLREDLATSGEE